MAPKRRTSPLTTQNDPVLTNSNHHSHHHQFSSTTTEARQRKPRERPPGISPVISASPTLSHQSSFSPLITEASQLSPGSSIVPDHRQHRGSSATMRPSSLPYDGPPMSTPTGRISKAKKGKRVHACSFEGCGKVFTRAEHRRRHELNHNPEALYRCPQPGCSKAFHRVDLLQRHQERHDLESTLESSPGHQRHLSQVSMTGEVPSSMPTTSLSSPAVSQGAPRPAAGNISIGSLVHPHDLGLSLPTPHFVGLDRVSFIPQYPQSDDSMFFTPESSQSPVSEAFGRYPHRQSVSSSSSGIHFDPNRSSPLINGTVSGPWIPTTNPPTVLPGAMFDDGYVPSTAGSSVSIPLSELDGYEWSVIRRELSSTPGIISDNDGAGLPDTMIIRWSCLENYWDHFHPCFPIVHRPTFLPTSPSPLLASAMAAIGSLYDDRPDAKLYSLTLLETATKLLRRRNTITSRSRLADLQTVFLLEILSKYCSRRVEVEMSARFRALYASLDQARRSLATNPLAVYRTLRKDYSTEGLAKAHKFWVEHETRRRILQACIVLDKQQSELFQQAPTVIQPRRPRVSTHSARSTISLPCSDQLWESSPVEDWATIAANFEYIEMDGTRRARRSQSNTSFDYFQTQVGLATESTIRGTEESDDILETHKTTSDRLSVARTVFNEHVSSMVKHTPVQRLLLVSGESWIFGRKLESESEFQASKDTLRLWLDQREDSLTALWHATALLRGQFSFESTPERTSEIFAICNDTHMLHESWGTYLAALICWAYGFRVTQTLNNSTSSFSGAASVISEVTSTHSSSSSRSLHPSLMDHGEAAQEMQDYLRRTDVATPQDLLHIEPQALSHTNGLLETVRMTRIGHQMGGLMNDAERVLFRLVDGRSQLSHF